MDTPVLTFEWRIYNKGYFLYVIGLATFIFKNKKTFFILIAMYIRSI